MGLSDDCICVDKRRATPANERTKTVNIYFIYNSLKFMFKNFIIYKNKQ